MVRSDCLTGETKSRTQMGLGLKDRKIKTEKYIDTIFKTSNYIYSLSSVSGSVLDRVLQDSGKVPSVYLTG